MPSKASWNLPFCPHMPPFNEKSAGNGGLPLETQICGAGLPDTVMVWLDGTPGVNGKVGSLVKTGGRKGCSTDSETTSKTPPGAFNSMLLE